jgi:hypothetical protein
LKKFLENVHKIKASEKAQNPIPEPRKIVKSNDEPEVNMLRQVQNDPFYQQQMELQQNYNQMQDLQDSGSPGDGKKVSYKPHNYKTVPCVFFHSPQGCSRGDNCHFIHDWNYNGRETPNMRKYVRNNLITKPGENPMIPPTGLRTGSDIPLERPQQQPQQQTTFQGLTNSHGSGNHFFPQQQQQQQQQHTIQQTQHHQIQHHQQHQNQHHNHHQNQHQNHHQQGHFDHHNQRPNFSQGGQRPHVNNFQPNQRPMHGQFGGQMGRPQQQPPIRSDMAYPGGGPPLHGGQYQPPNFFHQQQQQQQPFHPQHPQGNIHMGGNMQNRHMMNQQHGNYGS